MSDTHRIPVAYQLRGFKYGGAKELLRAHAAEIIPEEYDQGMRGTLFCPGCTVPLVRVPHDSDVTSSGMTPHFRHKRGYEEVRCGFRTSTPPGKRYTNRETIKQAIEDGELSIISSWSEDPPEVNDSEGSEFNGAQIVDEDGPEAEVPLGEHSGETFKVPSRVTSVLSLFKNFSEKISKYYFFPGGSHPILLREILVDLDGYNERYIGKENVYYGEISGYVGLTYRNIIKIKTSSGHVVNIYTYESYDKRRGVDKNKIGRTVAVHGKLVEESGQIRIWAEKWGQYCLVPDDSVRVLAELKQTYST
ncbi:hypothetical protein FZZ93_05695 [Halomonas eurihalina]|uniref:Uncharacterized protein n=1 Tax=Halomonas eurihalina TaxID=42566 RepID=A0A5D9DAD4_HALER|nr:hypothetical protein [Halomonas eurihalina]MDR5859423.1 hypothetical protein [Halomonas eurihalina]TZG40539.1 hypothetical protein FZZ93_05695 [Halomonas eurihalina]